MKTKTVVKQGRKCYSAEFKQQAPVSDVRNAPYLARSL